jgi:hypothetical protein
MDGNASFLFHFELMTQIYLFYASKANDLFGGASV